MSAAFPVPGDDGGANHLVRGLAMPDIALPATTGEQVILSAIGVDSPLRLHLDRTAWSGEPT